MQGVGLNREARMALDLVEQLLGQDHVQILNRACFRASEVAVGIAAVAVKPAICAIKTLNHPCRLQGLEVLIHRGMADVAAKVVQLFKNISGTQVALFGPEQIQHHAPLAAKSHTQGATSLIDLLNAAERQDAREGA
jgi:hypothetical protein